MSLVDEIAAIRSREDLSDPEKLGAIYDLKGQAIVDALVTRVGTVITRGVFTLTLTEPPVFANRTLRLVFDLARNGVPVPISMPLYIVNPPVLVPDGLGGYTLNLVQAIRDVIMDLAR